MVAQVLLKRDRVIALPPQTAALEASTSQVASYLMAAGTHFQFGPLLGA